jgi:hypothetical protein
LRVAKVPAHGLQQGCALEGDAFQRGAGDVGDAAAAREAEDGAARIGLPIGRAEPGEGRDEDHAAAVGNAFGKALHRGAGFDGLQAVAQPLHHGAADEDAAFQCVLGLRTGLRGAGGDQAVVAGDTVLSGLHEHEAARAIGILGQSGGKQAWPKSALCWSPAMPPMVIGAPKQSAGFAMAEAVAGGMHRPAGRRAGCRTAPAVRRPTGCGGCRTAGCARRC